jgi:hypothetical protein
MEGDQINFGKCGIVCLLCPRSSAHRNASSPLSKTGSLDRPQLKSVVGSFGQGWLPRAGILGRIEMYNRTKRILSKRQFFGNVSRFNRRRATVARPRQKVNAFS